MRKVCFKCNIEKDLTEFYKHKQMGDGHLNKCKDCNKKDTKNRQDEMRKIPEWVVAERKRGRRKYHRLNYNEKVKEKIKSGEKRRNIAIVKYKEMYPEKKKAESAAIRIPIMNNERHHWSYNQEHWKDIIDMTRKDHYKAHRFITYDTSAKMYRNKETNELLDTKEKHLEWIEYCIKNKED